MGKETPRQEQPWVGHFVFRSFADRGNCILLNIALFHEDPGCCICLRAYPLLLNERALLVEGHTVHLEN